MADILTLDNVCAGYGRTTILDRVGFSVRAGEALALIGRNGVGKTTLLATIMGHTTLHGGAIAFDGAPIQAARIWERARRGVGLVPQEREIFPSLTVAENLAVAARGRRWTERRVYDLFPPLERRRGNRGNQLSGGEQQMLAIGRALMGDPSLLLLDEPLEGLAPVVADAVLAALESLRDEAGLTLILVEQHARVALLFAPRALALDRGVLVHDGPSAELLADEPKLARLIAVARDISTPTERISP
jgi:branched-chain amino acid transport system ATP-binding protein